MNQPPAKSRIKLNRRGLTELVLACAFLALSTYALWSWQNHGGYVAAMESTTPAAEASLLPQILRHPAIMFSTIVTEFVLLLALMLAIVPLSWWVRTDYLLAGQGSSMTTPLRWLGEKLHLVRPGRPAAEGEVQGVYVTNEAGERVFVPTPGVDPEIEQEVIMVEQSDGTLMAMVQQPDGTMAPVESLNKEGSTEGNGEQPAESLTPLPQQSEDILNFSEEEEDPLADLADIGDILSSAFDDESAIDPEREAISRSLEEVDIHALAKNARLVLATFQQ
jgi:hypothetical protein